MASTQERPNPGPDVDISGRVVGASIPLATLSVLLCSLRLYTRIRPVSRLSWDDWTISGATVCATLQCAFIIAAVPHGYGRHNIYVTPENNKKAGLLLFSSQIPWTWAVALSKISISCLLLRLKYTIRWKVFLYTMIVIQVLFGISANAIQLGICQPLAVNWDPSASKKKCWPPRVAWVGIIVNATISAITDIMFACTTVSFVYKIKRPLREKILVSFLMALGILAGAASITKLTKVKNYTRNRDWLYDGVDLVIWNVVEAQAGIIAACVPCLKSPCERVLRRIGWLPTCTDSNCTDPNHKHRDYIGLSSMRHDGGSQEIANSIAGTDCGGSRQSISGGEWRRSLTLNQLDTEIGKKA